jgi:hypothetical protein
MIECDAPSCGQEAQTRTQLSGPARPYGDALYTCHTHAPAKPCPACGTQPYADDMLIAHMLGETRLDPQPTHACGYFARRALDPEYRAELARARKELGL